MTMRQLEVFSPAKINLFLSVVGKMESGFHELVSLVAPIDFGDRVTLICSDGPREVTLECDDSSLPTDSRNLAYAAAEKFLEQFDLDRSVQIILKKRIPHGAGLGGGSSNASAVLKGLAQLEGVPIDESVFELAAQLGSDCPLFLQREPVIMRGRGEILSHIPVIRKTALTGVRVLLFRPSFSIGTGWAYGCLTSRSGGYTRRKWSEERITEWLAGKISLPEIIFNSFEEAVFEKFIAFRELFDKLLVKGYRPLMSGSGSCCFAFCQKGENEDRLVEIIRDNWGEYAFVQSASLL